MYDAFNPSDRVNIYNFVSLLQNQLKQTDKVYKKIITYDIFKYNPYLFKGGDHKIDLPHLLQEYQEEFSNYVNKRDIFKTMYLDYDRI